MGGLLQPVALRSDRRLWIQQPDPQAPPVGRVARHQRQFEDPGDGRDLRVWDQVAKSACVRRRIPRLRGKIVQSGFGAQRSNAKSTTTASNPTSSAPWIT